MCTANGHLEIGANATLTPWCPRHRAAISRAGSSRAGFGSATIWQCCRACRGSCRAGFVRSLWRQRLPTEPAEPQNMSM